MTDEHYLGVLLVLGGILLIAGSFQSAGGAQLFYIAAGVALLIWGILWQRKHGR